MAGASVGRAAHDPKGYDFNRYRALTTLVGHPLVLDARKRDQLLELVAYPVELVVTEQRAGYKFALSHRAEGQAVFMEAETPTRWRVIDFSAKLLAVQEILGGRGLSVPKQGRERVLELLKDQHPSLPIRADIADADLPAVEGQAGAVLQMQPLDEGLTVAMVVRPFGAGDDRGRSSARKSRPRRRLTVTSGPEFVPAEH